MREPASLRTGVCTPARATISRARAALYQGLGQISAAARSLAYLARIDGMEGKRDASIERLRQVVAMLSDADVVDPDRRLAACASQFAAQLESLLHRFARRGARGRRARTADRRAVRRAGGVRCRAQHPSLSPGGTRETGRGGADLRRRESLRHRPKRRRRTASNPRGEPGLHARGGRQTRRLSRALRAIGSTGEHGSATELASRRPGSRSRLRCSSLAAGTSTPQSAANTSITTRLSSQCPSCRVSSAAASGCISGVGIGSPRATCSPSHRSTPTTPTSSRPACSLPRNAAVASMEGRPLDALTSAEAGLRICLDQSFPVVACADLIEAVDAAFALGRDEKVEELIDLVRTHYRPGRQRAIDAHIHRWRAALAAHRNMDEVAEDFTARAGCLRNAAPALLDGGHAARVRGMAHAAGT